MTSNARDTRKKDPPKSGSARFWHEVRGYAEALIVAYLIVTFIFTTVGVVGSSMRPNLNGGSGQLPQALFTGDRVFIPKFETWLRRAGVMGEYDRGDIVVVREPENAPTLQELGGRRSFFIKRVIARPGDHFYIQDGQVYVNGDPINQSFISSSGEITPDPINYPVVTAQNGKIAGFQGFIPGTYDPNTGGPAPVGGQEMQLYYGSTIAALAPVPANAPEGQPFLHELIVPADHYFLMGDNRESSKGGSEDSRYFGPVTSLSIAGQATAVIWPPRRDGGWNWRLLNPPAAFNDVPPASQAAN